VRAWTRPLPLPCRAACASLALLALVLVIPFALQQAFAADLDGRVVGVKDGDTIELLAAGNVRTTVRLAAIDAPELKQAYGQAAKRALSALAFDRPARVAWTKTDDYGRVVGKLWIDGADVNLQMVERGYAWHYKRYAGEQTAADRQRYAAAEVRARDAKRGLWADPDAVPPWLFRHGARAPAPSRRTLRHIKSRATARG
jgi:endonuclease YncB( thermonuclease family)